jgi:hypothetical protein
LQIRAARSICRIGSYRISQGLANDDPNQQLDEKGRLLVDPIT